MTRLPRTAAKASKRRPGSRKEHNQLQESCKQLAAAKYGVTLLKVDSQARLLRKDPKTGRSIYKSYCTPGIPDSIAVISPTGRFAGFEIKTGKWRQLNDQQKETQTAMLQSGAAIYKVSTIHEFDEMLGLLVAGEKAKAALSHDTNPPPPIPLERQ